MSGAHGILDSFALLEVATATACHSARPREGTSAFATQDTQPASQVSTTEEQIGANAIRLGMRPMISPLRATLGQLFKAEENPIDDLVVGLGIEDDGLPGGHLVTTRPKSVVGCEA